MNTKFPCIIIICIFAINLPSQLFLHCHLKPHKFFTSFGLCIFLHLVCSRSQNNINVVYCNYKEITIRYREITEHNFPHSIPNVHAGIICDLLSKNPTSFHNSHFEKISIEIYIYTYCRIKNVCYKNNFSANI